MTFMHACHKECEGTLKPQGLLSIVRSALKITQLNHFNFVRESSEEQKTGVLGQSVNGHQEERSEEGNSGC